MSVVRITREEFEHLCKSLKGFRRYRSPFGVVFAALLDDDIDFLTDKGPLSASRGDYLCVAEDVLDCWNISPTIFSAIYEPLPDLD
jgi:hypothetical protein